MTATQWADSASDSVPVNWRELEVNAFEFQPSVLRALDPRKKYLPHASRRNWRMIYAGPLMVLYAAGLAAPIFAYATATGGRFVTVAPDPHVSIPWVGGLFAWALAVQLLNGVLWIFSDRPTGGYLERLPSYLAIVFGVLCALIVAVRGSEFDVANWQLWLVPVIGDAVVGLLVITVLALTNARRKRSAISGPPQPKVEPLRPVRVALEKLPASTREALHSDIDAAITVLALRGTISAETAAEARTAPLGKLGLYMSGGSP